MFKTKSGFTIVELLIVIVVIGILAAITVIAYNGFQGRAKNTQTQQVLASWIKGFQLYKADNGRWPIAVACLGEGYLYGPAGTATSGVAQCRQSSTTVGVVSSSSFDTMMKPYLGNSLPAPAFITTKSSDAVWWRGLTYVYGGGGTGTLVYIEAAYAGDVNLCAVVGGITPTSRTVFGGNTYCFYQLGLTSDT